MRAAATEALPARDPTVDDVHGVRSAWWVIRSSWVTMIAAVPRLFISWLMRPMTWSPSFVSRAEVGSFEHLRADQ